MNMRKVITLIAVVALMGGTVYAKTQKEVPAATQTAEVKQDLPTLIDISAEWCSACQAQKKILDGFLQKYGEKINMQFVDATKDKETVTKYNVTAIPTLVFLAPDGKQIHLNVGVMEEAELLKVFADAGFDLTK